MPSRDRFGALRVAIVGYGSIGRRHCDNLQRLGIGRCIVVRRQAAANPAFTPPADVAVVHTIRESIERGLDLAIVCNPTSLHAAAGLEYVAAGVPVLIEKPLASRLDEAQRLIDAAARTGVAAGMAYCMRYHPAYARAHGCVSDGSLAPIESAKVWFETYLPDWHPWEDYRRSYAARRDLGGGVLPTLDHELDFLNWCFGMPQSWRRNTSRSGRLEADVDDVAHLTLQYPRRAADVTLSLCQPKHSRGFEFVAAGTTLRFSFQSQRLELASDNRPAVQILWREGDFDLNSIYLEMLRDALEALTDGREPPIPLTAGLDALRLAQA